MKEQQYVFGMIGLGTMGLNVLLNLSDHGFAVAGFDTDAEKADVLNQLGDESKMRGFTDKKAFIDSLKSPRSIMMLVPAGKIVDEVIAGLLPLLDKGDIIIDGGNSHFTDTDRRAVELEKQGYHFFGMGISGGEEGARLGPSMMPGGDKQAYLHVKDMFEAIAAKVKGEPCVTYLGPGAAGHFVKMVHNGIEYALMQLLAETYQFLKVGLQLKDEAIQKVFAQWNQGRLQSFLVEITADIFAFKNPATGNLLVEDIKDEAKSKGTGKWTSQGAMDLQVSTTVIDTAVSMRDLSKYKELRVHLASLYRGTAAIKPVTENAADYLPYVEEAFYCSMVTTYAQGMHMLAKASEVYKYNLRPGQIAKIWRGGCIIRARFLEDIYNAYQNNDGLQHLLADGDIQAAVQKGLPSLRRLVSDAVTNGIAIPAFAASLTYFDTITTKHMPSNLIQAQRDFFGAHTYELIGKEGVFHTDWKSGNA